MIEKGLRTRTNVGFIPFVDYNDSVALLELDDVGTWTDEQICTLPYSPRAFNSYMSTNVFSLRALIRMDQCSAAGDLTPSSHVIAAMFSHVNIMWMLQDNMYDWYPTMAYDEAGNSTETG